MNEKIVESFRVRKNVKSNAYGIALLNAEHSPEWIELGWDGTHSECVACIKTLLKQRQRGNVAEYKCRNKRCFCRVPKLNGWCAEFCRDYSDGIEPMSHLPLIYPCKCNHSNCSQWFHEPLTKWGKLATGFGCILAILIAFVALVALWNRP